VEWAKAGIQMMDSLDFVERHFWYGLTTIYGTYQNEALINQDGSLTPVGQVFHDTLTSNANLAGGTLSPTDKYADIVLANDKLSATYTTANGPGSKNIRGIKSGVAAVILRSSSPRSSVVSQAVPASVSPIRHSR
jgi:hypothetical protein